MIGKLSAGVIAVVYVRMKMSRVIIGLVMGFAAHIAGGGAVRADEVAPASLGEIVFKRDCAGCHEVGPNARHGVGPHLNALFGRSAAGVADFRYYSKALKASGLVWSEETFAAFIENPRDMVINNKQIFDGLKNKDEIAALTEYLARF